MQFSGSDIELENGSGIFPGNTIFCKLSQIPNILCIGATNAIISGTSFELILNSIQLVAVGQINSKTSLLWTKWRKIEAVSTSSHAQNLVNYRVKVDEQYFVVLSPQGPRGPIRLDKSTFSIV
uniref:Uncharacterized protein n=1 Tax=Romanomermis culicivorax TaxID=13658 RepID=A0A915K5G6_ROMCU